MLGPVLISDPKQTLPSQWVGRDELFEREAASGISGQTSLLTVVI